MLIYNLMSLFRQGVLKSDAVSGKPDVQHTIKTLRYKLFATAGYITKDNRKKIINLAVAMQQREKRLKLNSTFPMTGEINAIVRHHALSAALHSKKRRHVSIPPT